MKQSKGTMPKEILASTTHHKKSKLEMIAFKDEPTT